MATRVCVSVCESVPECVWVCVLPYYVCVFDQISLHFETFARLTKNLAPPTAAAQRPLALWANGKNNNLPYRYPTSIHDTQIEIAFVHSENFEVVGRNLIESAWKCQASCDLPFPRCTRGQQICITNGLSLGWGRGGGQGWQERPPGRLQMVHIKYSLRCRSVRWSKWPEKKRNAKKIFQLKMVAS